MRIYELETTTTAAATSKNIFCKRNGHKHIHRLIIHNAILNKYIFPFVVFQQKKELASSPATSLPPVIYTIGTVYITNSCALICECRTSFKCVKTEKLYELFYRGVGYTGNGTGIIYYYYHCCLLVYNDSR